jgi:membrane-associated phospholipid phosphatase
VRATPAFDVLAGLPDPVVAAAALVTLLGDPLLLLLVLAVGYWRAPRAASDPRRAFAALVCLGLASAGVVLALKAAFALPRPPGAAEPGFGFPSGHALAAGAVYGGAARLFDRVERRRRLFGAAALVVGVALSRVVLGVHYLVDVAVGAALGVALAAAVARPRRAAVVAAGCGLAAVALGGPRTGEAAVVAGGAVGAVLAPRSSTDAPLGARVVIPGLVAVGVVGSVVTEAALPVPALALAGGALVWAMLALPDLAKEPGGGSAGQNVSR